MIGFWALMAERAMGEVAMRAMLDVSAWAAMHRLYRIDLMYQRTDAARNNAVAKFLQYAQSDEDALIMLDADHVHPPDITTRLIEHMDADHEVVAALSFRRSEPHDPMCYVYRENGEQFDTPIKFTDGLMKFDVSGTGCMAIRRSVFRKLKAAGYNAPYFRYVYKDDADIQQSEDWYFGDCCRQVGIPHWVDTDPLSEIPHITTRTITRADWYAVLNEAATDLEAAERKYSNLKMTFERVQAPVFEPTNGLYNVS